MRTPRIYQATDLQVDLSLNLDEEASNHVGRVLRMQVGQELLLFNGDGKDYRASIEAASKKQVQVKILQHFDKHNESALSLHLGQVISRGERMEFTIQKSVELGVNSITPLTSERCGVKLNHERFEKKRQQWQKIAIAACEQSGRAVVPEIKPLLSLENWAQQQTNDTKLNLHPKAQYSIKTLPQPKAGIRLLIGPEGGLSEQEIAECSAQGFAEISLGPRVLRTETAALTALSALQLQFGDLA